MGFANFYKYFIQNYSEIALSFTCLTHKDATWNWSTSCEYAFNKLKEAFTMVLVLVHWDPEVHLIVETNTSDAALATILSTYKREELCPIAFHSRSFHVSN